jgi:uncharacterized protein YndB with AHSA1/START domain
MDTGLIAKASTMIEAPVPFVWGALTKPKIIKRYMFGTEVVTDWKVGSPITWKGEWKGKSYEDKGKILKLERERTLQYSHFSPLSGKADAAENYHTVTIELERVGDGTMVTLSQDNNSTEADREHSKKNWQTMLDGMKELLEQYLSQNPACRIEDLEGAANAKGQTTTS